MDRAAETGSEVVVEALTDEHTVVTAQPSGLLKAEISLFPERVLRDGEWLDVDLTLIATDEGLAPRVGVADVVFSPGGTGPAARLREESAELALSWPGRLPVPVLEGDTATYEGVLPEVDLVLNQLDDTFRAIVPGGGVVGTRGQEFIRVIVTGDGRVINAFPVNVR